MVTALLRDKRILPVFVALIAFLTAAFVVSFLGGGTTEMLYAFGAGAVVSGVLIGVYTLGTRSGHPHSHAVAESAIVLGVMYLGLLVHRLLTEFGTFSSGEALLGIAVALGALLALVGTLGALGRSTT